MAGWTIWGPERPAHEVRPLLLWVMAALLALATAQLSPALPVAVAGTAALITVTDD